MKNSIFADEHGLFDRISNQLFLAKDFFGIFDTHSRNFTYPVLNIYTFRSSMVLKIFRWSSIAFLSLNEKLWQFGKFFTYFASNGASTFGLYLVFRRKNMQLFILIIRYLNPSRKTTHQCKFISYIFTPPFPANHTHTCIWFAQNVTFALPNT